jgi:hypothetical protein
VDLEFDVLVKRFEKVLDSEEVLELCEEVQTATEPGEMNLLYGPCLILAEAIKLWLGKEAGVRAIISPLDGLPDHMLVQVGDWYLDGSGVSLLSELRKRWSENGTLNLVKMNEQLKEVASSSGIKEDFKISKKIAEVLTNAISARYAVSLLRKKLVEIE